MVSLTLTPFETGNGMPTLLAPPDRRTSESGPFNTTRHLCAGVHVDEGFRDLVIREVCTAPRRRVAPSYGFDLVPVMHHAWLAAHLTAFLRLSLLSSVAVPFLFGHTVTTALMVGGFFLLHLLDRAVALSAKISRTEDPLTPRRGKKRRFHRRRPLRLPSTGDWRVREETLKLKRVGIAALIIAFLMLGLGFGSPAQAILAGRWGCAVLVVTVLVGIVRQIWLNGIQRKEALRPKRLSARATIVAEQQDHPCVVYRRPEHKGKEDEESSVFTLFGDESPFIGAGELIHQWNPPMTIQLLRPGSDDQPLSLREHRYPPFKPHELVDHLREAVDQLRGDDEDVRLPVNARDRVYVADSDLSDDRALLKGKIDKASMRRIIDSQDPNLYHFLEVSVPDAGTELMATVLLQVGLRGRTLSLVFAACALTRTPDHFRKGGEYGQSGKRAVLSAAFGSLTRLPREVTRLPRIVSYPWHLARRLVTRRPDPTLTPTRNVSIASRLSIREEKAQEWNKVQLDKIRLLGHMKNIERRLLKATSDFLCSRGVDISEFDDRATQIINSGILNLGGQNHNSNVVGDGAHVENHAPQQNNGPRQNGNAA